MDCGKSKWIVWFCKKCSKVNIFELWGAAKPSFAGDLQRIGRSHARHWNVRGSMPLGGGSSVIAGITGKRPMS
jgi:hypothetical protein